MNKTSPFFSVIIPTYNRPELLRRALQSVINQEFQDWECIIIDDGSDDHNVRMVPNELNDKRISYHYEAKKERSAARNLGIDLAKGSNITFLDDDDEYKSTYLSDFQKQLSLSPNVILRTGYEIRKIKSEEDIHISKATNYKKTNHTHPVQFAAYYMMGVWSLCIPANFLKEIRFPIDFPHWQDTHMILRLLATYDFIQLSNHNYIYHQHGAMGSIKSFSKEELYRRTELNVAAIDDLFENYGDLVNPFLPTNTHHYLRTEKYLRNASLAAKRGDKKLALKLLKHSGFESRLWKTYLRIGMEIMS